MAANQHLVGAATAIQAAWHEHVALPAALPGTSRCVQACLSTINYQQQIADDACARTVTECLIFDILVVEDRWRDAHIFELLSLKKVEPGRIEHAAHVVIKTKRVHDARKVVQADQEEGERAQDARQQRAVRHMLHVLAIYANDIPVTSA